MNPESDEQYSPRRSRWKEVLLVKLLGGLADPPGRILRNFAYRSILGKSGKSVRIQPNVELLGTFGIEIGDQAFIASGAYISADGCDNQIHLGARVHIDRNVRIFSAGNHSCIRVGERARLDRGVDIRAHHHASIELESGLYIGPYTCIAGPGTVRIGRDCLIASHCGIYANNHLFDDLQRSIKDQGVSAKGITIGDDCWLGTGVKVLDGVTIGKGSVIGAGAVVTKDIPPYSIAVGVPAKVIGQRKPNSPIEASVLAQVVTGCP